MIYFMNTNQNVETAKTAWALLTNVESSPWAKRRVGAESINIGSEKAPFSDALRRRGRQTECSFVAWPPLLRVGRGRAHSRENPSVISRNGSWRRRLRLSTHAPDKRREKATEYIPNGLIGKGFLTLWHSIRIICQLLNQFLSKSFPTCHSS